MSLYDQSLSTHKIQSTAEITLRMCTFKNLGTDVRLLKCTLKCKIFCKMFTLVHLYVSANPYI